MPLLLLYKCYYKATYKLRNKSISYKGLKR
ncbi:hypothetical protein MY4824_007602 [Beauveria thailandica]